MLEMQDYNPANLGPASIHVLVNLTKLLVSKGVLTRDEGITLFSNSAQEHEELAIGTTRAVNRQAGEMLRLCEAHLLDTLT